jgi:hypothetical protein
LSFGKAAYFQLRSFLKISCLMENSRYCNPALFTFAIFQVMYLILVPAPADEQSGAIMTESAVAFIIADVSNIDVF